MESICGGNKPYLSAVHLESEHLRCKDKALEQFNCKRKMGGEEFSQSYKIKLESVSKPCFSQHHTLIHRIIN